jgi:hypothetical protein
VVISFSSVGFENGHPHHEGNHHYKSQILHKPTCRSAVFSLIYVPLVFISMIIYEEHESRSKPLASVLASVTDPSLRGLDMPTTCLPSR